MPEALNPLRHAWPRRLKTAGIAALCVAAGVVGVGLVTRVSAEVRVTAPGAAVPPAAAALAERAVASLVEPLRGLGGEATATRVDVEVRCDLGIAAVAAPPR